MNLYQCLICTLPTQNKSGLCPHCQEILIQENKATLCLRCGLALSPTSLHSHCAACIEHPPAFNYTLPGCNYTPLTTKLIQNFKYHHQFGAIEPLLNLLKNKLVEHYQDAWPEIIIPVPLHAHRLRLRGYNQADILAKYFAKAFNIEIQPRCCQRIKSTPHQTHFNAKKRQAALHQAFRLNLNQTYRHIAIIDDVMTTGTTVGSIAALAKKQNIKHIDVWCLARTQRIEK